MLYNRSYATNVHFAASRHICSSKHHKILKGDNVWIRLYKVYQVQLRQVMPPPQHLEKLLWKNCYCLNESLRCLKQLYRLKTDHFLALFCFYSAPVPIIVACYLYMPQWVHTNLAMVPDFSKHSPVSSHLAEAMGQKKTPKCKHLMDVNKSRPPTPLVKFTFSFPSFPHFCREWAGVSESDHCAACTHQN